MAAPKGATYTAPASSPLAGQSFQGKAGTTQAYNRYLNANAQALGFTGYSQQRSVRTSRYGRLIYYQETQAERFGEQGKLTIQGRNTIQQALADLVKAGPNAHRDKSIGGPLDQFLQRIGRRTGTETWPPGETP